MSTSSVSRCFFDSSSVAPIASGSIDSYGMTTRVVSLIGSSRLAGPRARLDHRDRPRTAAAVGRLAWRAWMPGRCSTSSPPPRPDRPLHLRRDRRPRRSGEVDARRAASTEAQVVSTDEFWDGEGFELSRLRAEVFEPLLAGEPAEYAAWDWVARRPGDPPRGGVPGTRRRRGRLCPPPDVPRRLRRARLGRGAVRDAARPGCRARRRGGAPDLGRAVDAGRGPVRRARRPGRLGGRRGGRDGPA